MSSSIPTQMDMREMDVLRFFFELNQQQMDPIKIQQILLQHQMNQLKQQPFQHLPTFSPLPFKPKEGNISTPTTSTRDINPSQIPEPKIIFQYVPSPKFPTPTSTPERKSSSSDEDEREDYKKMQPKSNDFHFEKRCNFINLNEEQNRKILMTPTSLTHESDRDSDHENIEPKSQLPQLILQPKLNSWRGTNIYNNLPDIVMSEYDKVLRESHQMKIEVISKLNHFFPVNYEYNIKKSRIRTNYSDPHIADDRTRNNIASRRSRQRKKFLTHVHKYVVDFENDENELMEKQQQWLRAIIGDLENKILTKNPNREEEVFKLRQQCGFN